MFNRVESNRPVGEGADIGERKLVKVVDQPLQADGLGVERLDRVRRHGPHAI